MDSRLTTLSGMTRIYYLFMTNKKTEDCLTGECPTIEEWDVNVVKLSEGSGGKEMGALIQEFQKHFKNHGKWQNISDDGASIDVDGNKMVLTTDSYVVTPIFFPGGNIGKIAFCGTVNDLAVMGAKPLGLSLGLVLEEGFSKKELFEVMETIAELSKETGIPVVTGDTKVIERGGLDKIIINTTGLGIADPVLDEPAEVGDHIIVSGGIGEHGTALMAKRYELEASIKTDSKSLWDEISEIKDNIKQARDITRGGLAAVLNEIASKNKVQLFIQEEDIPMHDEVRALTEILGIELYNLACEGRFVCVCAPDKSEVVLKSLKKYNKLATMIGVVQTGKGVNVQTRFGKKLLSMPSGNIVPRIC